MTQNNLRYGITIPVETRAMMAAQASHQAVHEASLALRRYGRLAGFEVTDIERLRAYLEEAHAALETAIKSWGVVVELVQEDGATATPPVEAAEGLTPPEEELTPPDLPEVRE